MILTSVFYIVNYFVSIFGISIKLNLATSIKYFTENYMMTQY